MFFFFFFLVVGLEPSDTESPRRRESNALAGYTTGPSSMVRWCIRLTRLTMVRWCIRLTRLTLVCEVIRYRLVQVRQNQKKKHFSGWRPAIAFLYLFLFHSLLCLTSFLSQYKNVACLARNSQPRATWCYGCSKDAPPWNNQTLAFQCLVREKIILSFCTKITILTMY